LAQHQQVQQTLNASCNTARLLPAAPAVEPLLLAVPMLAETHHLLKSFDQQVTALHPMASSQMISRLRVFTLQKRQRVQQSQAWRGPQPAAAIQPDASVRNTVPTSSMQHLLDCFIVRGQEGWFALPRPKATDGQLCCASAPCWQVVDPPSIVTVTVSCWLAADKAQGLDIRAQNAQSIITAELTPESPASFLGTPPDRGPSGITAWALLYPFDPLYPNSRSSSSPLLLLLLLEELLLLPSLTP
jgi:hypothetical protein